MDKKIPCATNDVSLLASLCDSRAEGTGFTFGRESCVLFVNIQHSDTPDGDASWATAMSWKV